MNDREALHRRIVSMHRDGLSRWKFAGRISQYVKRYKRHHTRTLAEELNYTPDHVNRIARGWVTAKDLKHDINVGVLRRLTPTHFAAAGELMRKFEIEPREVALHLNDVAEHGGSVRSIRYFLEAKFGGDDRPEWVRLLPRAVKIVRQLRDAIDTPDQMRWDCDTFLENISERIET